MQEGQRGRLQAALANCAALSMKAVALDNDGNTTSKTDSTGTTAYTWEVGIV